MNQVESNLKKKTFAGEGFAENRRKAGTRGPWGSVLKKTNVTRFRGRRDSGKRKYSVELEMGRRARG